LDPKALGEFGLIDAIRRRARSGRGAWAGEIGDDAAVLTPRRGHDLVVTVDALVEDVHFRWATTSPRELGRKALAVSLSDVAAMGARPVGCLLVLALPSGAEPDRVGGLVAGLLSLARSSGCPLVGGDTVSAPQWMLTTTAFGEVPTGLALPRGGARPGDRICVAGDLGGAALGLRLLEAGRGASAAARPFVRRHLDPAPPLEVGPRLARARLATAAIDVYDGLAQDLDHVLRESGVGAEIDVARLPLPRGMVRMCAELSLDPQTLALAGGEDYALLFCAPPSAPSARVLSRRLRARVTEVGRVTRRRGARFLRNGTPIPLERKGWDHFKPPAARSEQ
jgi:thiamine-monophosphate kinase